jgi:hypothetical protein
LIEMVETERQRKARKEHESASHVIGLKATLDAGRLRDELANIVPMLKRMERFTQYLDEAVTVVEPIDLSEEIEVAEVIEEKPLEEEVIPEDAVQEQEAGEEKEEFDLAEAKSLIARLKSLVGEE